MTVADRIAAWLESNGIRHCFGIIGGGNVALFEAIAKRCFTKMICTHHEQAAVMAATAYFRVRGELPLCLVTTGAGSTNAITGIMAAYMDSVPLLVIAGNEASKYMEDNTRVLGVQGYESGTVAGEFTKGSWTFFPEDVEFLETILNDILRTALRLRYGPVFINLPKDVQNAVGN